MYRWILFKVNVWLNIKLYISNWKGLIEFCSNEYIQKEKNSIGQPNDNFFLENIVRNVHNRQLKKFVRKPCLKY